MTVPRKERKSSFGFVVFVFMVLTKQNTRKRENAKTRKTIFSKPWWIVEPIKEVVRRKGNMSWWIVEPIMGADYWGAKFSVGVVGDGPFDWSERVFATNADHGCGKNSTSLRGNANFPNFAVQVVLKK